MRAELLQQLMAADLAVFEMVLFLDTHPGGDATGVELLTEYKSKASALRERFTSQYGPLMSRESTDGADWIANPWPWDYRQEV